MSPGRLVALAREALLLELALYRSLARWVVRRPDVPAGATPIGYGQLAVPVMWLWIFGSATEVAVVEVVLRNVDAGWAEVVRLPLLVLGGWGVLWMMGMLAAHRVRPHLLTDDRIRIRSGARTVVDVPLADVASARSTEHELPGVVKSLHHDGDLVLAGVSSRTNVELRLTRRTHLHTSQGSLAAERVGLWVDDPRAVVRLLNDLVSHPARG
jgi:hypothetical protein